MASSLHIVCPNCDCINRVPRERLRDGAKCGSCHRPLFEGRPAALESVARFDKHATRSDIPLLVDFWAAWCGPCRALAPIVDEVANSYNGKVKVGKMDVDKNAATPQRYGIRGIPTLLIFKGGQVKEQIVGYVPKEQIEKALERHISS